MKQSSNLWQQDTRPVPPAVMGILNVTPDSFSDGGKLYPANRSIWIKPCRASNRCLHEGAILSILAVNPRAQAPHRYQSSRSWIEYCPSYRRVNSRFDTLISVDTSTAEVIAEARQAGANLINDVRALQRQGLLRQRLCSWSAGLPDAYAKSARQHAG